jgi:hypothetical protein
MVSFALKHRDWIRFLLFACAFVCGIARLPAAESAPIVGPGATKDEAINAYGWPTGQSQSGTKEILTYPQGRITLENGRVERVDFDTKIPWPAPRPRPGPASTTSVKKVETPTDFWLTNFEEAQAEARRRRARILALFTGSDWSPPSKQFQDEVALHPDFVNAFTGDFVFLRLDFPTRLAQPAAVKEQNALLRGKYSVTTYPALLVLSPGGTLVGTVDLTKPQPGDTYRERTIAAIRAVRDLLIASPPPPDPVPVAAAPAPSAVTDKGPDAGSTSVSSAFPLVMGAMGVGILLAALGWWFVWAKRGQREEGPDRMASISERISDAAGGLPTADEISGWSKERLRGVFAGLVETDSYQVTYRAGGGDGDLGLAGIRDEKPTIIVNILPGDAGQVSAKRVKELFGTITVEDVGKGWFVAPGGFSKEARDYAAQHPIVLMDADDLIAQMRAVPPISLQKILARGK